MSVFPSGPLTPLAATLLKNGIDPHLIFTSNDGTSIFYIDGPMSPLAPGVPGQDGMILKSHKGLLTGPPFKHKDLQAASQDGVTWTETVYDAAMITLQLEAHARTAQGVQSVVDEWQGAWNPSGPNGSGILEYIIPPSRDESGSIIPGSGGYWQAQVRLDQTWVDTIKQSPRRYFFMPITHVCRIDNAFWNGFPSMSTFGLTLATFGENFATASNGALGSNWTSTLSSGATLTQEVSDGAVVIADSGNSTQTARNLFSAQSTDTDFQQISITLESGAGLTEGVTVGTITLDPAEPGGKAGNDIWGRLDTSGNGIRARFTFTEVTVSRFVSHVETVMWAQPLIIPPRPGERLTLICGSTLNEPRTYAVFRGNLQILKFPEVGSASVVGSSNRGTGFGFFIAGGIDGFAEAIPMPVVEFAAGDQSQDTQSGFCQLANIGTQDGYAQFLVYGPGTFTFGAGPVGTPAAADKVTFGPLNDGQIALITTLPRLRGVVDESPGTPTTTVSATEIQQLTTLAFNGNIPPLVQSLESLFGVLPAQTLNLYSLLSGTFQTPLPGVAMPSMAVTQQIAVSITDGTLSSQIVAQLVPQRIAPASSAQAGAS